MAKARQFSSVGNPNLLRLVEFQQIQREMTQRNEVGRAVLGSVPRFIFSKRNVSTQYRLYRVAGRIAPTPSSHTTVRTVPYTAVQANRA